MNHYTQALAALKAQSAHKLCEVGDQWQTPPELFWGINAVFGPFALDLFTDGENSKCSNFYTVEDNALLQDWTKDLAGGKAFANPPYSRSSYDDDKNAITGMRNIMAKVTAERDKGAKIVLLLKSATSEVWWPENADHVAFVRGRISFDLPGWFIPASDKDKASSAGFAVAICVFDKEWRGQPMQYIERDTLLAQGNAVLAMIEQRANQLAKQYTPVALEVAEHEQSIPVSLLLPLIERVRNKTRRWPHNPDFWKNENYQDAISWFHTYLEWAIKDPESALGATDCAIPLAPSWTPKLLEAARKQWDKEDAEPLSDLIARKNAEIERQSGQARETNEIVPPIENGSAPDHSVEINEMVIEDNVITLPESSDNPAIYFDALGIPESFTSAEIGRGPAINGFFRNAESFWAYGRWSTSNNKSISIKSTCKPRSAPMFQCKLEVVINSELVAEFENWQAAYERLMAEIEQEAA